jgi:hypothetical protein
VGSLLLAITIAVAPAQLRIETTAPTGRVTVSAPGAQRLRLWCSVGDVSAPEVLGEGRFGATYLPPPTGMPTYAVVAAWDEDSGEAAAATVALAARTEIPVETEAGAQVMVVIHGRRTSARANAAGHARVLAWVWPGERVAAVTAVDAAGNATTTEVPIDVAQPARVFLLAPAQVAAATPARVYAFATGGATPTLAAPGARLERLDARPGVASAELNARQDLTLTAAVGDERVRQPIHVAKAAPPPARSIALMPTGTPTPVAPTPSPSSPLPSPARTTPAAPVAIARPAAERPLSPWELGAAATGRYAGAFVAIGGTVGARRRVGRWAIGLDGEGHYAAGTIAADTVNAGGLAARLAVERRFAVTSRAWLFAALDAGGHLARLRRTTPAGSSSSSWDGGPSVSAALGLLARVGPGLVEIAASYAWSPLLRAGVANNLDGVGLSVGFRAARWRRRRRRRRRWERARARRWPRRGDGTPARDRRRPAGAA